MHPVLIAGYVALFVALGGGFLFVNLLVGRLVRPHSPNAEKLEVYECGEPAIGSSFVQFDLRFYVVALLFIIFDVEVALFFPWATVFGKAVQLSDPELVTVVQTLEKTADGPVGFSATIQQEKQPETLGKSIPASVEGLRLSPAAYGLMREFGVAAPVVPQFVVLPPQSDRMPAGFDDSTQEAQATWAVARVGRLIAQTAVIDMAIFFAILLVGFAYVWNRGDLDWVRAVGASRAASEKGSSSMRL